MPAGSRPHGRTADPAHSPTPALSARASATSPVPSQTAVGETPQLFPPLQLRGARTPRDQSHKTPHPDAAGASPSAPSETAQTALPSALATDADTLDTPWRRTCLRSPTVVRSERSTASVAAPLYYCEKCFEENSHVRPHTPRA